jgi:protoporphyrinogen oxidase
MKSSPVVIVGAGPAGLTAGYELLKHGVPSIVLEQSHQVGGISRTETYKGYRFDIGGHRFFTKVSEVQQIWKEILADDFIQVPRLSRIYYKGSYFDYPLSAKSTIQNLGIGQSAMVIASYLKAKLKARLNLTGDIESFEDWVIDRFGERLYLIFFKTYTEKVWGISCRQIQADWAAQRIQGMSLKNAVINALFGSQNAKSLIKTFDYPRLGPGMMWERCQEILDSQGSTVELQSTVTRVSHHGRRVTSITVEQNGQTKELFSDNFISTMPITALVRRLDPPAPPEVIAATQGLKYRDFLIVSLVINVEHLFPDNWLYIHSPEFKVGRIQNFKNWSPAMVPDLSKTCLGMEYFCNEGDRLWSMDEAELIQLATAEVIGLGLIEDASLVEDGVVIRQKKAYPVYDGTYRQHLQVVQDYLTTFINLQTVGRNGMHRYNNQDHSMLTALLAARNIMGEKHDIWTVNVERSYHEEFTKEEWSRVSQKTVPAVTTTQPLSPIA